MHTPQDLAFILFVLGMFGTSMIWAAEEKPEDDE